jgi:hypothetical protein
MIGDERVNEGIDIQKTQRGKQRTDIQQQRCQRSARAATECPAGGDERQDPERKQVLPAAGRVDAPARIDKNQVRRPEQFSQVKTNRPTREQPALYGG